MAAYFDPTSQQWLELDDEVVEELAGAYLVEHQDEIDAAIAGQLAPAAPLDEPAVPEPAPAPESQSLDDAMDSLTADLRARRGQS